MINLSNLTRLDVFFAWLFVLSMTLFIYSILGLRRTHKKIADIKDHEEKRWQELEAKAQKDYQEILETANKKAQEIILEATQIRRDLTTNFQTAVDTVLQNQKEVLKNTSLSTSSKYQDQIEDINRENIKLLINVYKDIEMDVESNFQKYKELIQRQTFEAEKMAEDKIKQEYEKLQAQIAESKQKKLQELNEKIYKIIQSVTKEVVGRSIDLSDQENLIIKALDNAKKEGIV